MPRVHYVKKAQKDNPAVKKGESYYWWKFRFGDKHYSKTHPRRSQLTQSSFLSQAYDLEDDLMKVSDPESAYDVLNDIASNIRDLGEECEANLDNMPESLQYSPTGELLQERSDTCASWADEVESCAERIDSAEDEEERQTILEEAQGLGYEGP